MPLLALGLGIEVSLDAGAAQQPQVAPKQPPAAVLHRVRVRGTVRCGAVARPGLAEVDGNGHWQGLEVDLCRAVALAVLGSPARIMFDGYGSPQDFDRVRSNVDDIFFLSGREIAAHRLGGAVLPGPIAYIASVGVLVPGDSPVRQVGDLAHQGICFLEGEPAASTLEEFFGSRQAAWLRHPYTELGEMNDAYAAGRCQALAAETTELAQMRLQSGAARLNSRLLPEALDVFPIITATGVQDGRWSAVVNWVVDTLVAAERPQRIWFAGGSRAMPLAAGSFGLAAGWQDRLVKEIGDYGAIVRRHLGANSPYRLERGPTANQLQGGLMLAPFVE